MANYEFQRQLAHDIDADGFAKHADVAANFVKLLHEERYFDQPNAELLVATVADSSLTDLARSRAYGKLRATENRPATIGGDTRPSPVPRARATSA